MKNKETIDSERIKQKLQLASDLFEMAFQVKYFQIKSKFPELTEKEINRRVYALIERGCGEKQHD